MDMINYIKRFLKWCRKCRNYAVNEQTMEYPVPMASSEEAPCFSLEQIATILKHCQRPHLHCIILMMATFGPRPNEAINLKAKHMEWNLGILTIPGCISKNGKPRTYPVGSTMLGIIRNAMPPTWDGETWLFRNQWDRQWTWSYLSTSFHDVISACGLVGFTLYALRHAAASRIYLESGCDEIMVQKILGHTAVWRRYQHRNEMSGFIEKMKLPET
jgi:integrase